ncbi:MAG: hypothetical protein M1828_001134 [Chrysothrix sp. TS-e1954]|nr:MAG: hypothetical protein M1828_001134 [Chrysothrix sp. TS-e1954]
MVESPLTLLAKQLLDRSVALDAFNEAHELPPVSFEYESFIDLPLEVEQQRKALIDLAQDLKRLAQGPRDLLQEIIYLFTDSANFHFVYHHQLPRHVPLDGDISYAELGARTGVDEVMLRRMMRFAMMNRIFTEKHAGRVCHSALSRLLATEPGAMDTIGYFLDEKFPTGPKLVEAQAKYPNSSEPNETAFNLAFNTSRSVYLDLQTVPERARRFGSAMRWLSAGGQFSNEHLVRGYNWAQFDRSNAVIVDVGGGHGAVATAIARGTQHVRFIVQDLPSTAAQGTQQLPEDLRSRIDFAAHDFFAAQPIKAAEVYLMKNILHNWADKNATKILRAMVPAMKDNSRILCVEFLPGDRSTTAWTEKQPYNMDMMQALGANSIERTVSDWERLFKAVDPRLQLIGTSTPPGCAYSLIEARFNDSLEEGHA